MYGDEFSEARKAQQELSHETDQVAAGLVRQGVPLWEAIQLAMRKIRDQRRKSSHKQPQGALPQNPPLT